MCLREIPVIARGMTMIENVKALHPLAKLRLACEEIFYGPGAQELLILIEETESVRLACGRMGMSYSKGWKMIAMIEKQLGYVVVERRQGGRQGGKSFLTPEGKAFVEKYHAFAEESTEIIQKIFEKHFT